MHSDFLTSLERDSPKDLQGAQISPPAVFSNPALPKTPAYQEVSMLILNKADLSTFLFLSARQILKRREVINWNTKLPVPTLELAVAQGVSHKVQENNFNLLKKFKKLT